MQRLEMFLKIFIRKTNYVCSMLVQHLVFDSLCSCFFLVLLYVVGILLRACFLHVSFLLERVESRSNPLGGRACIRTLYLL